MPQHPSATKASFGRIPVKLHFKPPGCFFLSNFLFAFCSFFCSRDVFHSLGLLSLFSLLNAPVSVTLSVGGPDVG